MALRDLATRPISIVAPFNVVVHGLGLGSGTSGLEVLVCSVASVLTTDQARQIWRMRHAGRPAPVMVVVQHGEQAQVCGPFGEPVIVYDALDAGQIERIARDALAMPDRHAALRLLRDALPAATNDLPGIRNEGLLATHELKVGVKTHADYPEARRRAAAAAGQQDRALVEALGYRIERHDNCTALLRSRADKRLALAVLLHKNEAPEVPATRFSDMTPLSYALSVADRESLPWVVVCQGSKLRLYPARLNTGVGRRSRTETFLELHASVLRDEDLGYLWMLLSADALAEGGAFDHFMRESERFAGDLAQDLRERIYDRVIPGLATAIAQARRLRKPKPKDLAETYEMALLVLFRLLFIAYAEDKDLLPYRWNEAYRHRSLKTKARELLSAKLSQASFSGEAVLWREVLALFDAVAVGNPAWGVPAYNGGLFTSDAVVNPIGALVAEVELPDNVFAPVLTELLVAPSPEGLGPLDFRSLGVREFGTVYEGLLESELAVADMDLGLDAKGSYRPARGAETPKVRRGEIYLHDRSGSRKATASYFTKSFAVEHLLDAALEPALEEHLLRLDRLADTADASEALFDFRVADIAMGSGHFLVAAVDRIERGLAGYMARRPLAGVRTELAELRAAATQALGSLAEEIEIEDTQLLRRLVARRCVYGVDQNPTSVQLARLALWVHTFVPGLPLSFLDHNLVIGNSLVGIADFREVEAALSDEDTPLLKADPTILLDRAKVPLRKMARLADANLADVERAKALHADLRQAVEPIRVLCDMVTAARVRGEALNIDLKVLELDLDSLFSSHDLRRLTREITRLQPFHFPIAFPEVFLRKRGGFDVILGNPPWEEATLEKLAFWARHFPGLRGLGSREQNAKLAELESERPDLKVQYEAELAHANATRDALMSGGFEGMGTGDPDLYKGFTWRFWALAADSGGRIGVVLPRSAMNAKGSTAFRQVLFESARTLDICMLLNNRQWVFETVHPQYTIGLVAIQKQPRGEGAEVRLKGPYSSYARFNAGRSQAPYIVRAAEVQSWSDSASLPLLPSDRSMEVFAQIRKAPRLDDVPAGSWHVRPHRELDASLEKQWMDLESEERPRGFWPVFTGESFDLWTPDTGSYFGFANPKEVVPYLFDKRRRSAKRANSAFAGVARKFIEDKKTLGCMAPRIAFRDVTRATDSRTVRTALVPSSLVMVNQAPYLLWVSGDERDQAYLLGVLSSIPLDWYARRFVETHLNFFVFNPLPIPRPPRSSKLWLRVVALAGRMAAIDDRFAEWAAKVGVTCGPLTEAKRNDHIAELDAVVAHLYGLTADQLRHVFETFHEGWDTTQRLAAVLKHFAHWEGRS